MLLPEHRKKLTDAMFRWVIDQIVPGGTYIIVTEQAPAALLQAYPTQAAQIVLIGDERRPLRGRNIYRVAVPSALGWVKEEMATWLIQSNLAVPLLAEDLRIRDLMAVAESEVEARAETPVAPSVVGSAFDQPAQQPLMRQMGQAVDVDKPKDLPPEDREPCVIVVDQTIVSDEFDSPAHAMASQEWTDAMLKNQLPVVMTRKELQDYELSDS